VKSGRQKGGQVKKSYRRRKVVRVTPVMRLGTQTALQVTRPRTGPVWTAEHRFHRAGEPDGASWRGSARTSYLGYSEARPTTPGSSGVVARVLSLCAASCSATDGARAAGSREVVSWRRNATGSGPKLWQRGELTDAGLYEKCSVFLCRRCHASQCERE
jgi:hypothetical protein